MWVVYDIIYSEIEFVMMNKIILILWKIRCLEK